MTSGHKGRLKVVVDCSPTVDLELLGRRGLTQLSLYKRRWDEAEPVEPRLVDWDLVSVEPWLEGGPRSSEGFVDVDIFRFIVAEALREPTLSPKLQFNTEQYNTTEFVSLPLALELLSLQAILTLLIMTSALVL